MLYVLVSPVLVALRGWPWRRPLTYITMYLLVVHCTLIRLRDLCPGLRYMIYCMFSRNYWIIRLDLQLLLLS